jgi:hypothetical protein
MLQRELVQPLHQLRNHVGPAVYKNNKKSKNNNGLLSLNNLNLNGIESQAVV